MCRLTVADNGIGFDEKYLDRIFNVFQRLHGRGEYEGTGIGLAVCRKIAERHGGSISARSSPGVGSTFIVTLPIHHIAVVSTALSSEEMHAG
jgi:signal transduction histidine kinase